jgi:hypothetical protein
VVIATLTTHLGMGDAAGFRAAAVNVLHTAMPTDIAVCATGHSLNGVSAFFEYVDPSLAKCMPGARVLAGWLPPPHGQMGYAPKAPSLEAVVGEVGMTTLELVVDRQFNLDTSSPPEWLQVRKIPIYFPKCTLYLCTTMRFCLGDSRLAYV